MTDTPNIPEIIDEPLHRAISDRYLQYALSIIMDRALPDARDGLKPVQRRILYAMRELKLGPGTGFRKCAKITGDVMGNYHPHGDQAIYDALARLAQEFNVRYPLINGQGNFGNIDGDKPASSRYTEARLTHASELLMAGLTEDAVDFRQNYDSTLEEPVVLPASYPNLLANGSSGIAVGMATNIPPHNIDELCDASLHLIKHPNASIQTLVKIVPGPDFPTGGVIIDTPENIANAYGTGKGQIRVRAKWEVEKSGRNWCIVVTQIPYQVKKSKLIESIAKQIQDKKIQLLVDIRDESTDDVRIVLVPKGLRANPDSLMEALFRQTELETRVSFNMNALVDGRTPKVCSIKELLLVFLNHRKNVLKRRSQHRLDKIDNRLVLLEGYLVAYLNLDRVIEIIRFEDEPKHTLIDEFQLLDIQAEAILNMRLRSLRKLEEIELNREQDALTRERAEIEDLLSSDELQWQKIANELRITKNEFVKNNAGTRRTIFKKLPDIACEQVEVGVDREPVTIVCSKLGWIRTLKGTLPFDQDFKFRDGDSSRFIIHAQSSDRLTLFATNGKFYSLPISSLPGGKGMGQPIRVHVDMSNESEIVALFVHDPIRQLLLASSSGCGFIVNEEKIVTSRRAGKHVFSSREGDHPVVCIPVDGDHFAFVGKNRRMLALPVNEIPVRNKGLGVRLQSLKKSSLANVYAFNLKTGLKWTTSSGMNRTERNVQNWIGRRGSSGKQVPHGFTK